MKLWDASALVPLLLDEPSSGPCSSQADEGHHARFAFGDADRCRELEGVRRAQRVDPKQAPRGRPDRLHGMEVPEGVVRNLLGPGGWPATLSREQVERVEEAIRAGETSRLARERVVSLEAGGALRERIERTDIVVDGITDPDAEALAAVLETGRRLALRALPALDGERSYVEVAFERGTLANMRQHETAFGLVDLPDVETLRIHTGLTVDHGVPTVVGAAKEEGRWRVLLVEVRTVP